MDLHIFGAYFKRCSHMDVRKVNDMQLSKKWLLHHQHPNNSTRDTATEAPLPYKVTETPISYNHSISVYIESFITINDILALRYNFTNFEETIPLYMELPSGGRCRIQHSNIKSDVVFRVVRAISPSFPVRYWPGQITAALNMEANCVEYEIIHTAFCN